MYVARPGNYQTENLVREHKENIRDKVTYIVLTASAFLAIIGFTALNWLLLAAEVDLTLLNGHFIISIKAGFWLTCAAIAFATALVTSFLAIRAGTDKRYTEHALLVFIESGEKGAILRVDESIRKLWRKHSSRHDLTTLYEMQQHVNEVSAK